MIKKLYSFKRAALNATPDFPTTCERVGSKLNETPVIFLNLGWESNLVNIKEIIIQIFVKLKVYCLSAFWRIRQLFLVNIYKDVMQGKLFQKCTHLLYCSVLSLGGNVNTRRMSQPDMGSIFHLKNQWNILVIGNYYVNYQNYQI